jgi:hypothetical protein
MPVALYPLPHVIHPMPYRFAIRLPHYSSRWLSTVPAPLSCSRPSTRTWTSLKWSYPVTPGSFCPGKAVLQWCYNGVTVLFVALNCVNCSVESREYGIFEYCARSVCIMAIQFKRRARQLRVYARVTVCVLTSIGLQVRELPFACVPAGVARQGRGRRRHVLDVARGHDAARHGAQG